MRNGLGLAALLILAATACTRGGVGDQAKRITTVDAISMSSLNPEPMPAGHQGVLIKEDQDALEELIPEPNMEELARLQPRIHTVRVLPDETLEMFTEWSGIPAEDLKLQNGGKSPGFGAKYYIPLSLAELENFQQRREQYWQERTRELYQANRVKITGRYTIKRGDNLLNIVKKHQVPLWFLVRLNNNMDPGMLQVGQAIIIPTIEPRKDDEPAPEATTHVGLGEDTTEGNLEVIVRPGESIRAYASWAGIEVEEIRKNNRHIKDLDRLRVGERVKLPLSSDQQTRFLKLRSKDSRGSDSKKKKQ